MTPPVLVLGAGPAGSCAAALLASHGVPVQLVEPARFPRHRVGESLQPATFALLDHHFGLGPRLAAQGWARKYGAVYVWGETRAPWTVLFDERLERDLPGLGPEALLAGPYEHAWQVPRAEFDLQLLEEALRRGAELVPEEAEAVLFEGERPAAVRCRSGRVLPAAAVIDASGQRALLSRQLGLHRLVSDLRCSASYTYYEGAGGFPGVLGRNVQWIVSLDEGWAWFIPIGPERTSVGVVTRAARVLEPGAFERAVQAAGFPLGQATREERPLRFARDWSFTSARFAGPGWMLAGDAACFVDPILSGGVDFAIRGGLRAALALLRAAQGEAPEALAAEYDHTLRQDYRAYLRLARYWYGNNRSVQGLFWEASRGLPAQSTSTPLRAFVYLTTGHYAADRHLRVFQEWQEKRIFAALGVDRQALPGRGTRDING